LVQGTERYATQVDFDAELTSVCTCPIGYTCKHAVAVMLEYLECLKHDTDVASVTERDRRLALLQGTAGEGTWDDTDEEESEDDLHFAARRSGKRVVAGLQPYLEQRQRHSSWPC
jgi:uncharacterized Zn finger protein